ncbi:MAG: response regulator transcription factor [Oscillospiraceae bacterium]|jgi:DNA-binding response OmpR family regulator|nr:response regulator transcription factor [Oscillospiraceae bacterium]
MKVLIVEDELDLAEAVKAVLQKNNCTVEVVHDGEYGLDCALTDIYDIIILDIMLPKMDGLCVLDKMRKEGIKTPVLMLTARGELRDKVAGLDGGADDYLPKPFHMEELVARVKALSRRKPELVIHGILKIGEFDFDPGSLTLSQGGNEVALTLKESQLLELLYERKSRFVSKDTIIEKLWSYDADVEDNHVESHVSLLRKKLAAFGDKLSIKTSRGVGYRLEIENTDA